MVIRVPLPERASSGGYSFSSSTLTWSSHQNRMSSTDHGWPSDHFSPLRKYSVHSDASALDSHFSARPGPISSPSRRYRSGECPYCSSAMNPEVPHSLLSHPMLSVPPYLPTVSHLCGTTYGLSGRRLSTDGNAPDATCAANEGASPYVFCAPAMETPVPATAATAVPTAVMALSLSAPLRVMRVSSSIGSPSFPASASRRRRGRAPLVTLLASWRRVHLHS